MSIKNFSSKINKIISTMSILILSATFISLAWLMLFKDASNNLLYHFKTRRYICQDCNIILISVDTLRPDRLGIYDYPLPTSPHIDNFFKDSFIFTNHFSQSSNTLPSHMSIFTSLYPQEHGVMFLFSPPLKNYHKTLPEILKNNGYTTLGLYDGAVHLNPGFGFGRGFESYLGKGTNIEFIKREIETIAKKGQKFFLFLHPKNPHDPYVAPLDLSNKFAYTQYQGNIQSNPEAYSSLSFEESKELFWSKVDRSSPADTQHLKSLYDAEINISDTALEQVFSELADNDLLDNTIIILTSDHGEEFQEHGKFRHAQLYDEVIKVPLLIKHPKIKSNFKINALTQSIDLAPTILEMLGLTPRQQFSGKSLLPLLTRTQSTINPFIISQWSESTIIRTNQWKLFFYQGEKSELYDLVSDSQELENIIDQLPLKADNLETQILERLTTIQYDYPLTSPQDLDEKVRKKLIKEGYF